MAGGQVPHQEAALGRAARATWSEALRPLARRYAYGTILVGSLLVLWWGVEGHAPLTWVSNILYVSVLLVIGGLEVWIPFTRAWGDIRKATATSSSNSCWRC